jgi:uncharacterized protein (DUF2267 family)
MDGDEARDWGGGEMSATGLKTLDAAIQLTNVWLHEVLDELGWPRRERAYHALRAVLHPLRDELPVEAVAALAAQLPLVVRGLYYEGWHPAGKPVRGHKREAFLAEVGGAFHDDRDVEPEQVARAVFRVLARHVSKGEVEGVKQLLPADLRALWP